MEKGSEGEKLKKEVLRNEGVALWQVNSIP